MSRPGSYLILRLHSKISVRSRGSCDGSCIEADKPVLPGWGVAPRAAGGGAPLLPPSMPLKEYTVRGRAIASNTAIVIIFFLLSAPIFTVCPHAICLLTGAFQESVEVDLERNRVSLGLGGQRDFLNDEQQPVLLHFVDKLGDLRVVPGYGGIDLDSLHVGQVVFVRSLHRVLDRSRTDAGFMGQLFQTLRDLRVATGKVGVEGLKLGTGVFRIAAFSLFDLVAQAGQLLL